MEKQGLVNFWSWKAGEDSDETHCAVGAPLLPDDSDQAWQVKQQAWDTGYNEQNVQAMSSVCAKEPR